MKSLGRKRMVKVRNKIGTFSHFEILGPKQLQGVVHFPDGKIERIKPSMIKFLNTKKGDIV